MFFVLLNADIESIKKDHVERCSMAIMYGRFIFVHFFNDKTVSKMYFLEFLPSSAILMVACSVEILFTIM